MFLVAEQAVTSVGRHSDGRLRKEEIDISDNTKTLSLDVYVLDNNRAWQRSYSDTVTVTVESGDPGGDSGEFEEHIRQSLSDCFDVASVTLR